MACRHVNKRDALATVNPSNQEGETSACGVESQKTTKNHEGLTVRRSLRDGLQMLLQEAAPDLPSQTLRLQSEPTGEEDDHRGVLGAVAPRCIGKGVSDLVSYRHQNEVLYRLWVRLVLKQPQALCELDRPFV